MAPYLMCFSVAPPMLREKVFAAGLPPSPSPPPNPPRLLRSVFREQDTDKKSTASSQQEVARRWTATWEDLQEEGERQKIRSALISRGRLSV